MLLQLMIIQHNIPYPPHDYTTLQFKISSISQNIAKQYRKYVNLLNFLFTYYIFT
jgi:hypothetical protein